MSIFGYHKLTRDQAKLFIINCYIGILKRYPEKDVLDKCSNDLSLGRISCPELLSSIIKSTEYINIEGMVHNIDQTKSYSDFIFVNKLSPFSLKKIIYLGFAINRPVGGMKVILRHSEIINTFFKEQVESCVFFPENSSFNLTWLDSSVSIKRDNVIDLAHDLVIIPEMWAMSYGLLLKNAGVRYGIFVQNGYLIFNELTEFNKIKLANLTDIYNGASIVLSISSDVTRCINSFFPKIKNHLVQITVSIDENLFTSTEPKENIITYMPRKLATHSTWVVHQLISKLPENWKIVKINNMTEIEVARQLVKSKIFLSFSDQEGLGLPPLEAAFAGNKVIGYTGQAGKEYWGCSIFKEIECGNLLHFVDSVIEEVNNLNSSEAAVVYPNFSNDLELIKNQFSRVNEISNISKFIATLSRVEE